MQRLDALCPYCLVMRAVTIPMFWYPTPHNARAGHLRVVVTALVRHPLRGRVYAVASYHGAVLTG
jgi:hypothetical protein